MFIYTYLMTLNKLINALWLFGVWWIARDPLGCIKTILFQIGYIDYEGRFLYKIWRSGLLCAASALSRLAWFNLKAFNHNFAEKTGVNHTCHLPEGKKSDAFIWIEGISIVIFIWYPTAPNMYRLLFSRIESEQKLMLFFLNNFSR